MGKVCCFTGHRVIDPSKVDEITKKLDDLVFYLVEKGFDEFRTGGAYGFDTFSAFAVLKAKEKYPQIKLKLFLACPTQSEYWSKVSKKYFDYVKDRADEISYAFDTYRPDVYFMRNRALVDGSDLCVAYLLSNKGGTFYTRNYAEKKGVHIIYLVDCKY